MVIDLYIIYHVRHARGKRGCRYCLMQGFVVGGAFDMLYMQTIRLTGFTCLLQALHADYRPLNPRAYTALRGLLSA